MRPARLTMGAIAMAALAGILVLGIARVAGGGTGGYLVRAIFDNSSFVIPGEQVKVAGVTVGTISAVQLTPENKAAVVLQITNRRFIPFRSDAHCAIGLESLLGEQFVQCTATQPRPPGTPVPPPLRRISSGPASGQHLLPISDTTTPVGLDLLTDITRLPEQERLRLIIAGLGAGLAGNGHALNSALLRADPALQQTDRVIAVLAAEDRTLADLTDESARVLAPLATQRAHLGGFFLHAGIVASAASAQSRAIEANLRDLPPFLRQLAPAAGRLGRLAGQMTPALGSLLAEAPAVNAAVHGLGPLAERSIPAVRSLGSLAAKGTAVFPRAHRLAAQLLALGRPLLPLATDLAGVSQSFDSAGGIEDVMRFIYYYTGSVNGETRLGHYIRSLVQIGCAPQRTSTPLPSCLANFGGGASARAASATTSTTRRTPVGTSAATGPSTTTDALMRYLLAP